MDSTGHTARDPAAETLGDPGAPVAGTAWLDDEERRTLAEEQRLLDRVADLAAGPGRVDRAALDAALRTCPARRAPRRAARVPRPRRPPA